MTKAYDEDDGDEGDNSRNRSKFLKSSDKIDACDCGVLGASADPMSPLQLPDPVCASLAASIDNLMRKHMDEPPDKLDENRMELDGEFLVRPDHSDRWLAAAVGFVAKTHPAWAAAKQSNPSIQAKHSIEPTQTTTRDHCTKCCLASAANAAARQAHAVGDRRRALRCWSQVIRFSHPQTTSIASNSNTNNSNTTTNNCERLAAVAFANRSLVLAAAGIAAPALRDIERAAAAGYPPSSSHKLLRRKALCLAALRICNPLMDPSAILLQALEAARRNNAHDFVSAIIADLNNPNLFHLDSNESQNNSRAITTTVAKSRSDTSITTNHLDKHRDSQDKDNDIDLHASIRKLTPSHHPPEFASFVHPSLEVVVNANGDRCIVATNDIPSGTTIVCEAPLAWVTTRQMRHEHCALCLCRAGLHGIYCLCCTANEPYCSEICRSRMLSIHAPECNASSIANVDDHTLLALRLFRAIRRASHHPELHRISSRQEIRDRIRLSRNHKNSKLGHPHPTPSFKHDDGTYLPDHEAARFLVTDFIQKPRADILDDICKALALARVNDDLKQREDQVEFVRAMEQVRLNAISISTPISDDIQDNTDPIRSADSRNGPANKSSPSPEIETMRDTRIGMGLYTTASLINHSCVPNTHMFFQSVTIHVRTLISIKRGEEITVSYGQTAGRRTRLERQRSLRDGWSFTCECRACVSNDTTLDRLQSGFNCDKCPFPLYEHEPECPQCHTPVDLVRQSTHMASIQRKCRMVSFASTGSRTMSLQNLMQFYADMQRDVESVLHPKSGQLGRVYDDIAAFKVRAGKAMHDIDMLIEAETLIRKSIAILEHLLGEHSPEVASEYHKLATLVSQIDPYRGMREVVRAIDRFSVLYGYDTPEVCELRGLLALTKRELGLEYSQDDITQQIARIELSEFGFL